MAKACAYLCRQCCFIDGFGEFGERYCCQAQAHGDHGNNGNWTHPMGDTIFCNAITALTLTTGLSCV